MKHLWDKIAVKIDRCIKLYAEYKSVSSLTVRDNREYLFNVYMYVRELVAC